MSKKKISFIIFLTVILSLLVNIVAGRFLAAKISTLPLLNRWKILSPQAPIVINSRETVRVTDSGDAGQAAEQIKSKISTIVLVNNNQMTVVGPSINLTSDGSFVTASSNFSPKAVGTYMVVLNDGRSAAISQKTPDLATGLTFFKAALDNVPVPGLATSKNLPLGQKIVFVQNSLQNFTEKVLSGIVNSTQNDIEGLVLESDFPKRGFTSSTTGVTSPGEVVANNNGEVLGIWNGNSITSSDVLKSAMSLYFQNPSQFKRPSFGFNYSIITKNDSKLLGLPEGARVLEVDAASPAHSAGLLVGDVITSWDNQVVGEGVLLEETLEKYKPGDKLTLSITRNKQTLTLNLIVGELK